MKKYLPGLLVLAVALGGLIQTNPAFQKATSDDFANHIQKPLVIDKGGYAQWWNGYTWNVIDNFEKGGLGDGRGFYQ